MRYHTKSRSVHALYHGKGVIVRVLAIFYILEIIAIVVGLAVSLPRVTYDNVCVVTTVPSTLVIYVQVGVSSRNSVY